MKRSNWVMQEIQQVLADWRANRLGTPAASRELVRLGHLPAEAWGILTKESVKREAANRVMKHE